MAAIVIHKWVPMHGIHFIPSFCSQNPKPGTSDGPLRARPIRSYTGIWLRALRHWLNNMGNFGYFRSIPKTHIVLTCKTIFNVHGKPFSNNPWMPCLLAAVWLVGIVCKTPKLVKNTKLWLVISRYFRYPEGKFTLLPYLCT